MVHLVFEEENSSNELLKMEDELFHIWEQRKYTLGEK